MTGGTLYFFMMPPDFKFGIPVVIKPVLIPASLGMTLVTFFPILSMMLVIHLMTGITVFLRMTFLLEYTAFFMLMAAIATHRFVLPPYFKLRLLIVIKMAFLPLLLTMAGLTFPAITPLMRIINGMARITTGRRILMTIIRVASLTAGLLMLAL